MDGDERAGGGGQAGMGGLLGRVAGWVPWSRQTLLFGLAVSLFVHVAMLLWAGLVVLSSPAASASDGDGEVPLAVVAESDLEEGLLSGLASELPTLSDLAEPELSAPSEAAPTTAEAQSLEMSEIGEVGGAGDVESVGGARVFGGGGGARFFGVEARGSRFAYVVDVSGSMSGDRIAALRSALTASVQGLFEHAHFVIVPYNDRAIALDSWEWMRATERSKRRLLGWFGSLEPQGGTDPLTSFREVFRLKPRPDAVYFMTDGVFSSVEQDLLDLLRRENEGGGRTVPVHCITLIERGAEETMREIARRSGGTYTHIGGGP